MEAEVNKLRRPRQNIQVYLEDSKVPATVSKDLTTGGVACISTDEAEAQLSNRLGRETKVYILVGEATPGKPLKWRPPGSLDLVVLQKKFVLYATVDNIEDIM